MKKRNKILSLLLCAALITVNLPVSSSAVYAAGEAAKPSKTAYADKTGLQTYYDLDSTTPYADTVQEVYFGKDGNGKQQKWKIAGRDEGIKNRGGDVADNIVLFAASPLASEIPFNADYAITNYDASWGCTYPPNSTISLVQSDHYGKSNIRRGNTGLTTGLLTSRFEVAEQNLMNDTVVSTYDTHNKTTYSTKDKLYLADSAAGLSYIRVGTNNDLQIDKTYWGDYSFWLRTPGGDFGNNALSADPNAEQTGTAPVGAAILTSEYSVVPAFDLNLTNVLFASSAPTAEAGAKNLDATNMDGTKSYDTMAFRWADTRSKIQSTATWNASEVNVTKGSETADVYLCVQGNNDKDWIWSQKVDKTEKITAQTIASDVKKIDSLSNAAVDLAKCEIWLETTDTNEELTYAKQAQEGYYVSITAGTGLEITSNNATQTVNDKTDIGEITVEVNSNYYLPADYITNMNKDTALLGSSGLTARKTDAGFTITGSPTRDVDITLPAATYADGQSQGGNGSGDNTGGTGSQTGDESSPTLWIALMLLALAGAGGTAIYTRRKQAR